MNAGWTDLQPSIDKRNLSPRKCEQIKEENAREEILLFWWYFFLSGTISVPARGPEDEFEDEKYISSFYHWASSYAVHHHQVY